MPLVNGFEHLGLVNGLLKQKPATTSFADETEDMVVTAGLLKTRDPNLEAVGESIVLFAGTLKRKS